jgi:cation transporter-like permease
LEQFPASLGFETLVYGFVGYTVHYTVGAVVADFPLFGQMIYIVVSFILGYSFFFFIFNIFYQVVANINFQIWQFQ